MERYTNRTYGDAFADVYDDWYHDVSDIDATVATLIDLSGQGRVLELGVGTGRLARPLALAGAQRRRTPPFRVTGIDSSAAMLQRLVAHDPQSMVTVIEGDMVEAMPPGPFDLVFVAYNTLFNLTTDEAQAACLAAAATRLVPGGRFVVEAIVPDEAIHDRDSNVELRSMTADHVVLSVSRRDGDLIEGHFIDLRADQPVRLRPWSIRYSSPATLDRYAAVAGLVLEHRWADFTRAPFEPTSNRHVSVYRRV